VGLRRISVRFNPVGNDQRPGIGPRRRDEKRVSVGPTVDEYLTVDSDNTGVLWKRARFINSN
jgi:hypothetical protein